MRPDKDYLSFSLIYNNGKRSLDLVGDKSGFVTFGLSMCYWFNPFLLKIQICKDKVEAEIWIAGLKALISSGQADRSKIDGWNDGGLYFDVSFFCRVYYFDSTYFTTNLTC